MPSRNVLKIDTANEYYHVYARGNCRQAIYTDAEDWDYFILLLDRYLNPHKISKDKNGVPYPNLHGKVELLCYCLMTNHFHLLFYQIEEKALRTLMHCVMTSYVRYFNKRHRRSGSLFESRYKAAMVIDERYFQHISRYIHLNPRYWRTYPYSSLQYYFVSSQPGWLQPGRVEKLFKGRQEYLQFLADYESHKQQIVKMKYDLADS